MEDARGKKRSEAPLFMLIPPLPTLLTSNRMTSTVKIGTMQWSSASYGLGMGQRHSETALDKHNCDGGKLSCEWSKHSNFDKEDPRGRQHWRQSRLLNGESAGRRRKARPKRETYPFATAITHLIN